MVDALTTMATELRSTTDHVIYFVVFCATIFVGFTWAILNRRRRSSDLPGGVSTEEADKANGPRTAKTFRSLIVAAYSLGALGLVLVLLGRGSMGSHPVTVSFGISLAVIGWLLKLFAEFKYLRTKQNA
ncbi:MAG: hypothetical protein ACJ72L_17205 [Marmoricola sp.]